MFQIVNNTYFSIVSNNLDLGMLNMSSLFHISVKKILTLNMHIYLYLNSEKESHK